MKTILIILLVILAQGKTVASDNIAALKVHFLRPKEVLFPETNPYSESKAALGKMLFFDPRLSKAKNISCASCHHAGMGWELGISKAIGATGENNPMPRKAETLYNLAWSDTFFWDGRAETLEDQALMAIAGPKAMAMPLPELIKRLKLIVGYRDLFNAAFPQDGVTQENVAKALATFERTLVSGDTPFDRWVNGDEKAISEKAKKGFAIFNGKGRCVVCHSGWNFTDGSFHDIGLQDSDKGRGQQFPKVASMQFAFKTPTLRNIVKRAPYGHSGSMPDLRAVIEEYNHGGDIRRPSLSPDIQKLELSRYEKQALTEFLQTLTSDDAPITIPNMVF